MKKLFSTFLILVGFVFTTDGLCTTITSQGNGDWSLSGTWDLGVPGATDDVVIRGSDSVWYAGAVTVNCNSVLVQSGGKLALNATTALIVANSLTLQASAFFYNGSSSATPVGSIATYSLDNASTVVHIGSGTVAGGNNLTFGNLMIKRSSGVVAGGNLIINGDLIINNSSATTIFRGANTSSGSLTHHVYGNVYIYQGTLSCIDNSTVTGIWNLHGNVIVSGANARIGPITSGGGPGLGIFNIDGNLSISLGRLQYASSATTSVGIFNLKGNLTMPSGATNTSGTGPFAINFVGSGTQNVTMGLNISFNTQFCDTVKSGSTVIFDNGVITWGAGQATGQFVVQGSLELKGTSIISGSGAFEVKPGATLKIGDANGITSSGALGNVQVTGTRTYSTSANYEYKSTTAQATGNGLPLTVNNLTINNSAGVTLSNAVTVSNLFSIVSGASVDLSSYNHTAEYLKLAGVDQTPGTHGSTASSATFQNSTYFGSSATGILTVNGALPVELSSFNASAKNGLVQLSWKTISETNSLMFDIQRKSANSEWTKIGEVIAAGNSNSPKRLQFY